MVLPSDSFLNFKIRIIPYFTPISKPRLLKKRGQALLTFNCHLTEENRAGGSLPTRRDSPNFNYLITLVIAPAPMVCPPSRIAKRKPSCIATGPMSLTLILALSPGMTISTPCGKAISPVTSVVRM